MAVDTVDRHVLEHDRLRRARADAEPAAVRRLALLGRPLRGFELRIVRPGRPAPALGDREVGELELRGPSVTPGLLPQPGSHRRHLPTTAGCAPATSGTCVDGRLVVCGRLKDMIIVGGRNVFPEDIERAAGTVDGVRAGNVIAFGSDRTPRPGVDRRRRRDEGRRRRRTRSATRSSTTVCDAVGVPPVEVVLVRPGTLPKTSSGKLQRSLCRDRYHADQLEPV